MAQHGLRINYDKTTKVLAVYSEQGVQTLWVAGVEGMTAFGMDGSVVKVSDLMDEFLGACGQPSGEPLKPSDIGQLLEQRASVQDIILLRERGLL